MSAKYKKSTLQSLKAKEKNSHYCHPCGNNYDSEKKFYEHCCGLLHQVRRKENEKNFKPCCFVCKSTFPTLDAYGSHIRKDSHKNAQRRFKQAIENGKTIEQLVKANTILNPIPNKPPHKGVSMSKKPAEHASQVKAQPVKNPVPNTNFSQIPSLNYGWNFNHSQPPLNYGGNNYYDNSFQKCPVGQYPFYQYYRPTPYNWFNHRGNEQFNNFHPNGNGSCNRYPYSNGNSRHRPQHYQQQPNADQYHNPSWSFPAWQNNQHYPRQRTDHFNSHPPNGFQSNRVVNEENSRLNTQGIQMTKGMHMCNVDNGGVKENDKVAAADGKKASEVEVKAVEREARNVASRKSDSPRTFDHQKCTSSKDYIPTTWNLDHLLSENGRPIRHTLSPKDFTFALPESQPVENFSSDNQASPKSLTKSPTNVSKKTPETPTMSPAVLNDGLLDQSPKVTGGLGSPRVQQQLNSDNLRNLVNLSCSRKDKFMLDKLMYEYDQMKIKAAMNRMGQNLVTLVDKDAAEDVIASLSSFGLLEPGKTEDERPSNCLSEKLIGQIEELIQRSYQNGHHMERYSEAASFQDCDSNPNDEFSANVEANDEFERSQGGPSLSLESCSISFDENQETSDTTRAFLQLPDSSATSIQSSPKKSKKLKKKKSDNETLPTESEVSDHCTSTAQDHESFNSKPTSLAPTKKKKSKSKSSDKSALPLGIEAQGCNPDDDMLRLLSLFNNETVSSEIDSQKSPKASTPKKKKKSDKSSGNVKEKKSKTSKSKSKTASIEVKTKKKKNSIKSPKKKKASLEQPIESCGSFPECSTHEKTVTDMNLGPENTPAEMTPGCDFPGSDTIVIKCEKEDPSTNAVLLDVIEVPFIKQETIQVDVIDLEQADDIEAPLQIPTAAILEKTVPVPSVESDDSSSITLKAINFAIEEENIQCEILHIERRLNDMKVAFERQLVEMKAAFEREVEEATFAQEKLKERRMFVKQQWNTLLKDLLKSQDGRAIASSLKRIFSEIPNDLKTLESENPLSIVDVQDAVALRDLPQSELIRTENVVQDLACKELNNISESSKQGGVKRKRLDKCENSSKKKSSKKLKTNSKHAKTTTSTEKAEPTTATEKAEPTTATKKAEPTTATKKAEPTTATKKAEPTIDFKEESISNIKKKELASSLSQVFPNCKDVGTVQLKEVVQFYGHIDEVVVLKMHRSHLYSCSNDGMICQFKTKGKANTSEMKCTAIFNYKCDKIVGMEIVQQKDETFIVTASRFGTLTKFDLNTGNYLTTLETKNEIVHITYRWGYLFVCHFDGNISRHSLSNLRELDSFPCSSLPITCVASATEGAYKILCIGSGDGLITLKEAHSGLFIRSYALEKEYPFVIQVHKEDSYTLGCHNQQCRVIYLHKLLNGDLLQKVDIVASVVCMQVVSQNVILLGGKYGVIRIYDREKKNTQLYYGGGYKTVSSVCLNHSWIISGSEDGTIEACELALDQTFVCKYGKCPGTFAYHVDIIHHVKKIHAESRLTHCLANNCKYTFQKDQADRVQHILSHVQLSTDK